MRSSLARCLASVVGCAPHEVPLPADGQDPLEAAAPWLGGRGLALVPVPEPERFALGGPWIARLADGRFVLRFGTPASGTIDDPQGGEDRPVTAGWTVVPLDLAAWTPPPARTPTAGTLVGIWTAPAPEAAPVAHAALDALAGVGLAGDRYALGTGSMGHGRPGMQVTLVDGPTLERLGITPAEARRNLVTTGVDLDALVGRDFTVGEGVLLRGERRCEPCAHLARVAGRDVLRPLVHRGGLRADVLRGGELRVGDAVAPC